MNPLTEEWVRKAEGDFGSASRESRPRKLPNHDAACFHAQQCVEKYLKAKMHESGISIPKTHDLIVLLKLVLPLEPAWGSFLRAFAELTPYGVSYRYPGMDADVVATRRQMITCRAFRREARRSLGIQPLRRK